LLPDKLVKTKVQQQLAQIKLFMIESTAHFAETKMNAAKFPEANFPAIRVRCTKPGGALSDYVDQAGVSADLASART